MDSIFCGTCYEIQIISAVVIIEHSVSFSFSHCVVVLVNLAILVGTGRDPSINSDDPYDPSINSDDREFGIHRAKVQIFLE